ncbi:MAG: hypothetical protein WAL75_00015 [Terracidiphilus sp.]
MHPLLIALIFVAAMASPAIVAVQYAVKPRRELALAQRPTRRLHGAIEGSVIRSVRIPASVPAAAGPRLLVSATPIEQRPVSISGRRM